MGVVANLVIRVRADVSDFEKQVLSVEKSFAQTGKRLQSIGSNLTRGITLPLAAAGAALGNIGLKFDEASDSIRAATGATGKQLDALNASFKTVFGTVPASMEQASGAIGELYQRTGLTGPALETLTTQLLNLSRVSGEELQPLIAATTRLFGDWSISTDQQSASLDYLYRTTQATGIGFTRLTELVVQFGAPMRALGFSFEQAAAMLGKWEKEGVNIETVLAGMRFALGNFAKAGLDPARSLIAVQQAIKGAKTESEAMAISFQTFGKRAATDMARAILEGRFNIDDLVASLRGGTDTINTAAAATLSAGEKFRLLGNQALLAAEPIATALIGSLEKLMPSITTVIEALANVVKWFADLPSWVQASAFGIAAFGAALGPVIYVVGTLGTALGSLLNFLRLLGSSSLIAGLGGLAGTLGSVGVALAGLGAGYAAGKAIDQITIGGMKPSEWVEWITLMKQGVNPTDAMSAIKSRGATGAAAQMGIRGTRKTDIALPNEVKKAAGAVKDMGASAVWAAKSLRKATELLTSGNAMTLNYLKYGISVPNIAPDRDLVEQMYREDLPVLRDLGGGLTKAPHITPSGLGGGAGFFSSAFGGAQGFGGGLASTVMGALQGGGSVMQSLAGFVGQGVFGQLGKMAQDSIGGFLGGALGSILPGLGSLMGPLVGWISDLFGGQAKKTKKMRDEWLAQAGGLQKVQEMAAYAGVSIDKLLSTKKTKTFEAEVKKLEAAFAKVQERVKGVLTDLEQTLSQGEIISGELWKRLLADADKAEVKQALVETFKKGVSQAGGGWAAIAGSLTSVDAGTLGNLGVLAQAAFGGMTTAGMSVVEILKVLGPGLQNIAALLQQSGLSASGFLAELMGWQSIVEANQPVFDMLAGINDMMVGLANSGLMTQDTFSALGSMITQAFGQLTAQGVAGNTALQMMQPQLQKLWSLMTQFGFAVDSGTQALIDQGLEAGIIGPQFKEINEQILDVLKAIALVLGADIPNALGGLPGAAADAAAGMNAAFGYVGGPQIGVVLPDDTGGTDLPTYAGGSGGLRDFGAGTLAMLHGNEAVLTDEQLAGMARPSLTFNINAIDARGVREVVEEEIAPFLADVYSGNMGGLRSRTRMALGVTG